MTTALYIKRDTITEYRVVQEDLPDTLSENQILLKIEYFAVTANNISYANLGDDPHYRFWDFFPADDDSWGKLPVWGFANVIKSEHPDIIVGEHIFGYFPLASHCVFTVGKVRRGSFVDIAPHRQHLSPTYNHYVRTATADGYARDYDFLNALLRPIFITSFLLDDFLYDNNFFGSDVIVASSASSKTAYGMAFLLHKHRPERRDYTIVGLTSPQNVNFVESLGIYDTVLTYNDITKIDAGMKTIYVDFSGNGRVRKALHEHLHSNLHYNAIVGGTHWDKPGTVKGLPGAKPQFFFAPSQVQKRMADWGREVYEENSAKAWLAFIAQAKDWMDIKVQSGQAAVADVYDTTLAGKLNPQVGYILTLED